MRLTNEELRDVVVLSILAFISDEHEMTPQKLRRVVEWGDTQDFEFRLECLRRED